MLKLKDWVYRNSGKHFTINAIIRKNYYFAIPMLILALIFIVSITPLLFLIVCFALLHSFIGASKKCFLNLFNGTSK